MKRRLICMALCLLLALGLFPSTVLASTDWPGDVSIEADAGIVMDAHSGAVLYGKNIHSTYPPASITKVLTALIVLERASMDETVTFSKNAVYNVDTNSTSAGYDTGDQASVKDCLYAVLLKSANEAANALAEHVAGSTEEFAVLMNEKAAELGCQDSHFTNPSGLHSEEHYVSAYDMALITRAAFKNEVFSQIVSTTYYTLSPNKQNPEGQGISPGNKMVKPNWPDQYRPDVIGGKTGFTSLALNTLVICAEQGDTKLVTVVLHSQATQYNDTKRLLDFGFKNFHSIKIADYDKTYSSIGDDLKISGLPTSDKPVLNIDTDSLITLPKSADFSEVTAQLDYKMPPDAPEGSVACINYTLGERFVGQAFLTLTSPISKANKALPEALLEVKPSSIAPASLESADDSAAGESLLFAPAQENETPAQTEPEPAKNKFKISLKLPPLFWKILLAAVVLSSVGGGVVFHTVRRRKKEEAQRLERRRRRAERLKETGISEAEFDLMLQGRRNAASDADKKR